MLWNDDLDALEFRLSGHEGLCVVHRLAFRAMLATSPTRDSCIRFFQSRERTFIAAAREKIASRSLPVDARFHLNSRDLRRANSDYGVREAPKEVPSQPS